MPDAKLSALTAVSVPALADLAYLVDVSDTTDDAAGSSRQVTLERLLGLLVGTCNGRLTTESGVPVSTSDRTSQSTIYFTPVNGNTVSLYDGTRWKLYSFTERSLALSGLTSGLNYDVFLYDNAGTLTLELTAWTNDTTRATALTTQDGVYVKTGATTRRYLGTIRTTGTTTTEDSDTNRFVWNAYNRVRVTAQKTETTSHTYNSVERDWRGNTSSYCYFVIGLPQAVSLELSMRVELAASSNILGLLRYDSTTVAAPFLQWFAYPAGSGGTCGFGSAVRLAAGYHSVNVRERDAAGVTSTFQDCRCAANFEG